MPDILGWLGTAAMASGSIDIAHKRVRGLWLMLLGNLFWGWAGYQLGMSSLIAVSLFMGALDIYGIYRWSNA